MIRKFLIVIIILFLQSCSLVYSPKDFKIENLNNIEYHMGDLKRKSSSSFYFEKESVKWDKLDFSNLPENKDNVNIIWYKLKFENSKYDNLEKLINDKPIIIFNYLTYYQSFEIYFENEVIFKTGKFEKSFQNKIRYYRSYEINLPDSLNGKTIFVRMYSYDPKLIGLKAPPKLTGKYLYLKYSLFHSAEIVITSFLFFAFSIAAFLFRFKSKKTNLTNSLSFGIFSLITGTIFLATADLTWEVFLNNYITIGWLASNLSLMLIPAAMFYFLETSFQKETKHNFRKLKNISFLIGVFVFLLLNFISPHLIYNIQMLFLAAIAFSIIISFIELLKLKKENNKKVRLITYGFAVFAVFAVFDLGRLLFISIDFQPVYHIGFLILSAFLAYVVIMEYEKDKIKLDKYSQELEIKTRALEQSQKQLEEYSENLSLQIEERTKSLEEANRSLITEIEERKKFTKEIKASERRFKNLTDAAYEGIVIHDKGIIMEVNKSICRLLDYDRNELIGNYILNFVAPEFHEATVNSSNSGTVNNLNVQLVRKGGEKICVEITAGPFNFGEKEMRVVSIRDITEKLHSEQELKNSEIKFRSLIEQSLDGIAITDDEGIVSVWNKSASVLTGLNPEDVIGKEIWNIGYLLTPKNRKKTLNQNDFKQSIEALLFGSTVFSYTAEIEKDNGEQLFIQIQVFPIQIGEKKLRGYFFRDITRERLAEEEIRKNAALLRAAIESNVNGLLVTDKDGKPVLYNQQFLDIWNLEDDWVEKNGSKDKFSILSEKIHKPEELPNFTENLKIPDIEEYNIIRLNDGRIIERYSKPYQVDNCIMGKLLTYKDITESKKAEDALRKAKKEAEESAQTRTLFLANMSHEIRTPMNAILGFTEIIENEIEEDSLLSYLSAIKTSGKMLLKLINDILDLSKIEAGQLELNLDPVELKEIFNDIQKIFSYKAVSKDLDFIIEIPEDFPQFLYLDEIRIRQILLNLAGNAVKFTEKGFIKLSADYKTLSDSNFIDLTISVEDTGIGIKDEDKEKIFTAFKQISNLQTAKYGGTGLGLSITKRLIEMMNGEISLKSGYGKGSIFTVNLNKIEVASEFQKEKDIEDDLVEDVQFLGQKVFAADDAPNNVFLINNYLMQKNLQFFSAGNGLEAFNQIKEIKPDIVLMDLKMPVLDGLKSSEKIRALDELKSIPIIALTAADIDLKKGIYAEVFNDFIIKPFSKKELISVLMKFLDYKSERRENVEETTREFSVKAGKSFYDSYEEIIDVFENELLNHWQKLQKTFIINEVEEFAEKVLDIGKKHKIVHIVNWSRKIITGAKKFDIENLTEAFKEFPEMIDSLKEIYKIAEKIGIDKPKK